MVGLEPQVLSTVYAGCYGPARPLPPTRRPRLPPRASHDGAEGPRPRGPQGRATLLPRAPCPPNIPAPSTPRSPTAVPRCTIRRTCASCRGSRGTWTRSDAAAPADWLPTRGRGDGMRRGSRRPRARGRRCARRPAVASPAAAADQRAEAAAKDAMKKASYDYLATNYDAAAASSRRRCARAAPRVQARYPGCWCCATSARCSSATVTSAPRSGAGPRRSQLQADITLNPDYDTPDLHAAFEEARGGTAQARWASSRRATSPTRPRASRRSTRRCRSTPSTRAPPAWCASSSSTRAPR